MQRRKMICKEGRRLIHGRHRETEGREHTCRQTPVSAHSLPLPRAPAQELVCRSDRRPRESTVGAESLRVETGEGAYNS